MTESVHFGLPAVDGRRVARVRDRVARQRFALIYAPAARTLYTVGLTERDLPELVLSDVSQQQAGALASCATYCVTTGQPLGPQIDLQMQPGGVMHEFTIHPYDPRDPDAPLDMAVTLYGAAVTAELIDISSCTCRVCPSPLA